MIIFVCALKCEAAALIRHFRLQSFFQKSLFPVYRNDAVFLIQSGVGKIAAAAAVSYLYARLGEPSHTVWINVGVGGHPCKSLGEGFYAHKIVDLAILRSFYPTFTWKEKNSTETVFTVDSVERAFQQNGIYEMEAAGFCSSAFALTTSEFVHCYKIISDNRENPPIKDSHFVQELVDTHLIKIESLIHHLSVMQQELLEENKEPEELKMFISRWHFTQTEFLQLSRLLQRWEALYPAHSVFDERINQCSKAKEVLTLLKQKLCFL